MSLPSSSIKRAFSGTSSSSPAQQSVLWFTRSGRARRCSPVLASHTEPASSKSSKSSNNKMSPEESIDWTRAGVPVYLQSTVDFNICGEESQALTLGRAGEMMWKQIRTEAQADANSEPLLSSFLYASILAHDTFEQALAFVLANRLANSTMLSTQLFEIFHNFLSKEPDVRCAALSDLAACRERDPACSSYSHALLYFKGYHAIQTQRIAHALWNRKQKVMALALQSRISEVFAVDIHPAARIGKGVLLDHGTGVVIGETAVIGNNVSILQNVTLGGTGKEIGDRHPKVGDNVLIGACATVLGNIAIGEGAQIAAGSLVLKPVPPHTMVAGSPAKEVGPVVGNPALSMMHWSQRLLNAEGTDGSVGMNGVPLAAAAAPMNGLANGAAKPAAKVVPAGKAAAAAAAASASAPPASAAASVQAAKKAAAKLGGAAKAAAAGTPAAPGAKAGPPAADVSQKGRAARNEVIRKKPAPEYEI